MDSRFRVLASTRRNTPSYSGMTKSPPELLDALKGVEQHDIRQEQGQDEIHIFVAVPVL